MNRRRSASGRASGSPSVRINDSDGDGGRTTVTSGTITSISTGAAATGTAAAARASATACHAASAARTDGNAATTASATCNATDHARARVSGDGRAVRTGAGMQTTDGRKRVTPHFAFVIDHSTGGLLPRPSTTRNGPASRNHSLVNLSQTRKRYRAVGRLLQHCFRADRAAMACHP